MDDEKKEIRAETDGAERLLRTLRKLKGSIRVYGSAVRGAMSGLLVGAKPATLFGEKDGDAEKVLATLKADGHEGFSIHNDILINETAVYTRLAEEPELADEVGWDDRQTIAENAARTSPLAAAPGAKQALMGFMLGYPGSAIRAFARVNALKHGGVPVHPEEFAEAIADGSAKRTYELDALDENDVKAMKGLLKEMKAAVRKGLDESGGDGSRGQLERRFIQEHEADFRMAYRKYLDLKDEDIDLLVFQEAVDIDNPFGETVYLFKAAGRDAGKAADVEALRRKTKDAFKAAGF